jgi:hypothetical protein
VPMSRESRSMRARVAALSRDRAPDDPEYVDAQRQFRTARLAEYVAEVVAKAPPLTDEQLEQVAALLRAGRSA